eukprot:COSAG02_NODE_5217_length_4532_cov_3.124521_1_plen_454_part_00
MAGAEGATPSTNPLTAHEKRVVWTHRLAWFLWEGQFGIAKGVQIAKWLTLCRGDAALMAQWQGVASSINACCNLFLNPVTGAISDSFARGPVIAFSKLGLASYFLIMWRATTPVYMAAADVLGWGVLSAGGMAVQAASLDDLFGDRPELNSRISSMNSSMAGLAGSLGPWIGILLFRRGMVATAFLVPAAMLLAQAALFFFLMPETLRPEDRVPFALGDVLTSANPFANCAILLRNGVELRRLALASCLYHGCTSTWFGTLEAYRSDAIGWSPDFILGYESVFFLSTAVSTAMVVPTLIARWGNRRLFQIWSYVAGAAYMAVGQAWRPGPGPAASLRRSVQYIVPALVLQDPWTDPCSFPLRAMVIKQGGVSCPSVGQGQLSAAYDGLTDIVGCLMPMVWGFLYARFAAASASSSGSLMARIGIGGHWMIAGCMRMAAGLVASSIGERGKDTH